VAAVAIILVAPIAGAPHAAHAQTAGGGILDTHRRRAEGGPDRSTRLGAPAYVLSCEYWAAPRPAASPKVATVSTGTRVTSVTRTSPGHTTVAAAHCGLGAKTGSLVKGKYADLVILESDPRKVDPEKIGAIKISQTWVNGRNVAQTA
jgi:hypothetical protein